MSRGDRNIVKQIGVWRKPCLFLCIIIICKLFSLRTSLQLTYQSNLVYHKKLITQVKLCFVYKFLRFFYPFASDIQFHSHIFIKKQLTLPSNKYITWILQNQTKLFCKSQLWISNQPIWISTLYKLLTK